MRIPRVQWSSRVDIVSPRVDRVWRLNEQNTSRDGDSTSIPATFLRVIVDR
jgi:hypothetical protein